MVVTRTKLTVGDRVVAEGEITLLTAGDDGRTRMTVRFEGAPAPLTLDASWSNQDLDALDIGDRVRLEGKLTRITHGSEPRWDTGSVKFDGYAYPITLPMAELGKA